MSGPRHAMRLHPRAKLPRHNACIARVRHRGVALAAPQLHGNAYARQPAVVESEAQSGRDHHSCAQSRVSGKWFDVLRAMQQGGLRLR